MRILFVTNYFEPDSGAAAVRLTRLARLLHQHGHELTVLTTLPHYPQRRIHEGYRHRLVVTENRDGLRVIQTWLLAIDSPRISLRLLSHLTFMLTAFLRGLFIPSKDVILIEAQPVLPALAGVALALLKRTPYLLNVSDLWPDHLLSLGLIEETSFVYRLSRYTVNFIYRHACQIVAMSPRWAEKIQTYIEEENKVKVIYNGVDLNEFYPDTNTDSFRQKYHLGQKKLISFIGTFSTQYDFQTMMEMISHFKNREDVQFVFIGQGSQNDFVKRKLSNGNFPNVRWIHWVNRDEVPQAWNASYVTYWAMGDHELYQGTIPAKLYESMACGIPVAASMGGLGADIIQESGAGIVVPCKDVKGLAAAVQRLLDDQEFHDRCSRAARHYAEQHYSHEKVASAYETILLEAAKK